MKAIYLLLLAVLFTTPVLAFPGDNLQQWQPKELTDQPGMSSAGDKYMLGTTEVDGVKSVAYLNDVRELMSRFGSKKTHHIMVGFISVADGRSLETGVAEITVVGPDGNIVQKTSLLPMEGSFGADLTLDRKGTYRFEISTSLADGAKRIFWHQFVN